MPRKKIVQDSYYSNSDDSDDGIGSFSNPYPSKTACAKSCDKYKRQQKKNLEIIQNKKKQKEVIAHIKHVKKMKMQVLILEKKKSCKCR